MMERTLIIVPTKDRAEEMNIFIQNLITQSELGFKSFDLFVADMSTERMYLKNNWMIDTATRRLAHLGHSWLVARVEGHNQLFGYQRGLEFAKENGYEYAIASDDDCVFSLGWIGRMLVDIMKHQDASCFCGSCLIPWESEETQQQDGPFGKWSDTEEFQGKLEPEPHFFHITRLPPDDEIREYEQIYGPFIFRVKDFFDVGGFPTWLSRLGFRGEMMAQTATFFNGRKLYLDPKAKSWHYSVPHGGLREVLPNKMGGDREECLAQDRKAWDAFMKRRTPDTSDPSVPHI